MVELTYLNVEKLPEGAFEKMCLTLPAERLKRVEEQGKYSRKLLSAAAGYLLQCALEQNEIAFNGFTYNQFGKPYLKDSGVYFNLSHSGSIAVCALSDGEVGVDVQKVVPVKSGLIKRVCTQGEYSFVTLQQSGIEGRFCRLWTVKESLIKFLGKGLSLSPSRIEVGFTQPLRANIDGTYCTANFKVYALNGYCITVCAASQSFPDGLKEITVE